MATMKTNSKHCGWNNSVLAHYLENLNEVSVHHEPLSSHDLLMFQDIPKYNPVSFPICGFSANNWQRMQQWIRNTIGKVFQIEKTT